jgi:tetratricopeptide (TPR) repeat protein
VFRQVLKANEEVRGASHPYVGYDHVNLANLLLLKGEPDGAEKEFRTALKIYARTLPPDHQYVASAQTGLARSMIELGRLDDAATAATRALTIWRASLPADHPQIANVQAIAGQVLALRGEASEAERVLAASYNKLSAAYGVSDPRTRVVSQWLAALYRRTDRTDLGDRLTAPQASATPVSASATAQQ